MDFSKVIDWKIDDSPVLMIVDEEENAIWRRKINVSLDPTVGTCEKESVVLKYGYNYNDLPRCKKPKYQWLGWYLYDDRIDTSGKVLLSSDCLLSARYSEHQVVVTVTFDAGEGTIWDPQVLTTDGKYLVDSSGNSILLRKGHVLSYDIEYGSTCELPNGPELTTNQILNGYEFKRWDGNYTGVVEDTTVTAVYGIIQYTITYDTMGGYGTFETQTRNFGQATTIYDTEPTKEDMTFWDWIGDDDNHYNPGQSFSENRNLSLSAFFVPEYYTIDYVVGEGITWTRDDQHKTYNTDLTLYSEKPTKDSSDFLYWLGSDGIHYNPGDVYTTNSDLTLTAVFQDYISVSYYFAEPESTITYEMNYPG